MASNDFANTAAATSAGYALVQSDRGPGVASAERFLTHLEKLVGGVPGDPAVLIRATGYGATQAAADTACVSAVNFERSNRYGGDTSALSTSPHALVPVAAGSATAAATAATAPTRHTKDST